MKGSFLRFLGFSRLTSTYGTYYNLLKLDHVKFYPLKLSRCWLDTLRHDKSNSGRERVILAFFGFSSLTSTYSTYYKLLKLIHVKFYPLKLSRSWLDTLRHDKSNSGRETVILAFFWRISRLTSTYSTYYNLLKLIHVKFYPLKLSRSSLDTLRHDKSILGRERTILGVFRSFRA